MSEIATNDSLDDIEPVDEEENLSVEENRRILGVQIGANLVAQRGEGISELLSYADQIEKFLEKGLERAPIGEDSQA